MCNLVCHGRDSYIFFDGQQLGDNQILVERSFEIIYSVYVPSSPTKRESCAFAVLGSGLTLELNVFLETVLFSLFHIYVETQFPVIGDSSA